MSTYVLHPEQPTKVDIRLVDGVFVKAVYFQSAGMFAPQHAHCFDHLSYIASGAVRLTADGETIGDFTAPASIVIKANVKHLFETLSDNTTVLCIHNADRAEMISGEHLLEMEG